MLKYFKTGKLTENTIYSYIAILTSITFGLLSKILLSKILTVSEIGLFITTQTFFIFVMFASGEWLSDSVVYYVAKNTSNKKILKNIFYKCLIIGLCISLTLASVYTAAKYFIFDNFYQNKLLFLILLLWILAIPFRVLSILIGAFYQGLNNLKIKLFFNDILPYFLIIFLLFSFYFLEINSIILIVIVYILSYFICSLILIFKSFLFLKNDKISNFNAFKLIKYGSPLFFAGIVNWPLASFPILIAYFDSLENVTFYTFTLSIAVLISLPISAIEPVLFPYWAKKIKNNNQIEVFKKLSDISYLTFLIATIIFVPIFSCASNIVSILFGSNYVQIIDYIKFLSILFLIISIFGPLDSVLKALGETKSLLKSRLIETFCVLLFVYPLVTYYSIIGSFLTYTIASISGLVYFSYIIIYKNKIFYLDKNYFYKLLSVISLIILECIFIYLFIDMKNDFLRILFVFILHMLIIISFLHLTGNLIKIKSMINEINSNT